MRVAAVPTALPSFFSFKAQNTKKGPGWCAKRPPAQFPVRARAWVAGQVPSWGRMRGKATNQCISGTSMFLSFSFNTPFPSL